MACAIQQKSRNLANMPAKPTFTDEQFEMLHAAALRVWRKFRNENKTQKDLAFALGLSQQSVSALIKGTYRPGMKVATEIATLDGKELEDLVGAVVEPPKAKESERSVAALLPGATQFKNLDVCLQFYSSTKHWSAWTIAAARAGFFGNSDFGPPEWPAKLDSLERVMEKARKM